MRVAIALGIAVLLGAGAAGAGTTRSPELVFTSAPARNDNLGGCDANDTADLFLLGANRTSRLRITTTPEGELDPAWSPDGARIAMIRASVTTHSSVCISPWDPSEVWIVSSNGRDSRRLTKSRHDASHGFRTMDWSPAWSPDGTRVAFARAALSGAGRWGGVYVVNADGTDLRFMSKRFVRSLDWSPDGRRLVLFDLHRGALVVIEAETRRANQLTVRGLPGYVTDVAWSPDGRSIAVTGCCESSFGGIFVVPATGGRAVRISRRPASSVTWSPGGQRLALAASGDIWVVGRNGRGLERWTSTPAVDSAPDWRP